MKKIVSFFATLMASIMLLTSFAACNGGSDSSSTSDSSGGSVITPSDYIERPDANTDGAYGAGRVLDIYLWTGSGSTQETMNPIIAEWKERVKERFAFDLRFHFDTQDVYKTKLTLSMSGASDKYDLIFDAPWMFLTEWAQEGYYTDMTGYFKNPNFPGLEKAFTDEYLGNNMFKGPDGEMGIYAAPLTENFGGGAPVVFYREDWRKEAVAAGASELANGINELEDFEAYLAWVKANKVGIRAPFGQQNDGAYDALSIIEQNAGSIPAVQYNNAGIKVGISLSPQLDASAYINPENDKVEEALIRFEKPGAESVYPAPFNTTNTAWQEHVVRAREWYENGWIYSDVLSETDYVTQFLAGQYGSIFRDVNEYSTYLNALKQVDPNAELEIYIPDKNMREKKEGVLSSSFQAWNFLGIPTFSNDKDLAVLFLDWLFESRENHDLFQYGIEGIHWNKIDNAETGSYQISTEGCEKYAFDAYTLTWNPTYLRMPADWSEKATAYKLYVDNLTTYVKSPYAGFRFDASVDAVKNALLNPDIAAAASQGIPYRLGVIENTVANYAAMQQGWYNNETLQADLLTIKNELKRQLQEYVNANKGE